MSLTLSSIPPFPVLSDRAAGTYNSKGLAVHNHLADTFVPEMQALLPVIDQAAAASAAAIAAANYKGPWASLAGALAIPATVSHSNQRWLLIESVADVTAHVPGVSTKWLSLSGTVELISTTTTAAAAANVEWSNFDTLAATYDHLELHASGVLGSAATATLTGQIRQSNTWQTAAWAGTDVPSLASISGLSLTNQLTNVAKQAMALQVNVRQLSATAVRHVDFVAHGGAVAATVLGYSNFNTTSYAPSTSIQGLRIYASTGNITGTFRLYGVRK